MKHSNKIFKIAVSCLLCVSFIFCLVSCAQEYSSADKNIASPYPTTPKTQTTPDWNAIRDNLDDALEQIESTHTYIITYYIDLEYNNSVGNEWRYGVSYNGEYIESSSKIVIKDSPTEIDLVAFATELDEWNDYGSTLIAFDALSIGQKQTKWATVIVRENQGRYTGNTAKWYFEITIERI